jgi:cobalamin synthase
MKEVFKNIFICLGVSALIVYISYLIQSNYIFELLNQGLIIILISLLAINTTTSSVILTKLKEISDKNKISFTNTIDQLHLSIKEQVWLIIVGLVFLIIGDSNVIRNGFSQLENGINTVLVAVFIYAILILKDTANAIFVILNHEKSAKD